MISKKSTDFGNFIALDGMNSIFQLISTTTYLLF